MKPSKRHYGQAAHEVASGVMSHDLLAMAVAESLGDEQKANAIYLKLRAEELAQNELAGRTNELLEFYKNKVNGVIKYCKEDISSTLRLIWVTIGFIVVGGPVIFFILFTIKALGALSNLSLTYLLILSAAIPGFVGILYDDFKSGPEKEEHSTGETRQQFKRPIVGKRFMIVVAIILLFIVTIMALQVLAGIYNT